MNLKRRWQRGQAMTEYALFTSIALAAMFIPIWKLQGENERHSTIGLFIQAFDIYINSFHAVITMPIP